MIPDLPPPIQEVTKLKTEQLNRKWYFVTRQSTRIYINQAI